MAVTVDRNIHVATADGRVHVYDDEGTHLRETRGPAPGFGPLADIVAAGNRVFVLDPDNGRVVRIDENGTESAFGSVGDGPDQLREPTGIGAFSNWIYVADTGNARVAVFNEDGSRARRGRFRNGSGRRIVRPTSPATDRVGSG